MKHGVAARSVEEVSHAVVIFEDRHVPAIKSMWPKTVEVTERPCGRSADGHTDRCFSVVAVVDVHPHDILPSTVIIYHLRPLENL